MQIFFYPRLMFKKWQELAYFNNIFIQMHVNLYNISLECRIDKNFLKKQRLNPTD